MTAGSDEARIHHGQAGIIPRGLLILGFGGHARSVSDVALDLGIPDLAFVEASARDGELFAGFPVFTTIPRPLQEGWTIFPAAGDNINRQRQVEDAAAIALPLRSLVSKRAYVGIGAAVKDG